MLAEEKFPVFGIQNNGNRNFFVTRTLALALYIFGFWTIFAIFAVIHGYAQFNLVGREIPWSFILVTRMSDWYFWALLTPFIFWLGRRFPFGRKNRWRNLWLIFVPVGLLTALIHITAVAYLMHSWSPDNLSFTTMVGKVSYFYPFSLLVYSGILAFFFVFDYNRKYQERELQAAHLKVELSQAQLRALQMQLQPHFLFNALHSISTLTFKDPETANLMLVKLSDLLRISLMNNEIIEVPLERELFFLQTYLDIEQIRFQDRLEVNFEIEPQTIEALVPSLILQPLVENSIRHGISRHWGKGVIEILAQRKDQKLYLKVRDNGLGVSEGDNGAFHEGVGLSNTRSRLESLYGENFFFELSQAPAGGIEANIIIPFTTPKLC
jgi:two-component system, LytTR family, sensor kinase